MEWTVQPIYFERCTKLNMSEFSFILLFTSLIAGGLTVFAPCIFTFLPVVLGAANTGKKSNYKRAFTIITSLAVSVFIFSILLKATTALIRVPQNFWEITAGIIILTQGLIILFPEIWEFFALKLRLGKSSTLLAKSKKVGGSLGDILTGAALGPIFSSCSPTYGFLIGSLLQSTFSIAILYLVTYILGLSVILLLIAVLGQRLVDKLKWGINPKGTFKRFIAIIFILIGLMIMTGFYKDIEAFIINNLPFLDVTKIDREILNLSI